MTQIVSNKLIHASDKIGFSEKSLKARAADFRAIASALGRQDIITAFNEHPAMSGSYGRQRLFIARVTQILWRNPDSALSYLQVRRSGVPKSIPNQCNRVRMKAKGRQDKERRHVAAALALDDPCASS